MVGIDPIQLIKEIHHNPRRLIDTLPGHVGSPVQILDAGTIEKMKMGDRIEGSPAGALFLGQVVGA